MRDLRRLIAGNDNLQIDNLSLILRGSALYDTKNGDDVYIQLNDGGIVIVLIFLFDQCTILSFFLNKERRITYVISTSKLQLPLVCPSIVYTMAHY